MSRRTHNVTANATVEVQMYLAEPKIYRAEDPLQYWESIACGRIFVHPFLWTMGKAFLEAGEVVSKKSSSTKLEKKWFLNKNEWSPLQQHS